MFMERKLVNPTITTNTVPRIQWYEWGLPEIGVELPDGMLISIEIEKDFKTFKESFKYSTCSSFPRCNRCIRKVECPGSNF